MPDQIILVRSSREASLHSVHVHIINGKILSSIRNIHWPKQHAVLRLGLSTSR
jgi:hypothetical protein